MNCFFHENKPAVIACAKCGVGLCRECKSDAVYTFEGKPLCLNCSQSVAQEELNETLKKRTTSLVKFIFSGLFLAVALIALGGGADLLQVWIIAGVAGIPTAFKTSRKSREQRIMDNIDDRYEKDMINLMFGWIIRLLFRLAIIIILAPICAIVTFVSNLIAFLKSKKQITEAQEILDHIEQCLNGESDNVANESFVEQTQPTESIISSDSSTEFEKPLQQPSIAPTSTASPIAQNPQSNSPHKPNRTTIITIITAALLLIGSVVGYFIWYVPYSKNKKALRTYVIAESVFMRSSKIADVEYNILSTIPYGSELITYAKDSEWAEIEADGKTGFVASSYLLDWDDFNLLNKVWGSSDTRENVKSAKCRLALLDYCKSNYLDTGDEAWQLYTLSQNAKTDNILFPRLKNNYDKFSEFAFILKNNTTGERRCAIYSFENKSETPVFLYEETELTNGQIKNIIYNQSTNQYYVIYTDSQSNIPIPEMENPIKSEVVLSDEYEHVEASTSKAIAPVAEENVEQVNTTENKDIASSLSEDNKIHEVVEQRPEYPYGGMNGLMSFIGKNITYPPICQEKGIQGKVIVSFVVEKDGSINDFKIARSVNEHLDREALRVLKSMPSWKPGKQKNNPVRVKLMIPVNFKLQ